MLTAQEIKSITCPSDGKGLFILVRSNNSKLWRLRYKYAGMHQEMALGGYPTISLSKARRMAEEARLSLIQGINPMSERRERKRASNPEDRAFGVIALKWWEQQRDSWSSDHTARVRRWIQNDAQKISELAIGGAIRSFMPLDSSWNPAVVSARLSSAKQSTWC